MLKQSTLIKIIRAFANHGSCLFIFVVFIVCILSCNEEEGPSDASVTVDSVSHANDQNKHLDASNLIDITTDVALKDNGNNNKDIQVDVNRNSNGDIAADIGSCICFPISSWHPNWNSCGGRDVIWGCKNNPQKFNAWADIVYQCYAIVVDKATGCPRPKINCYKSCLAPPDMPIIKPPDMNIVDL